MDLIDRQAAIDAIVGILTSGQALECDRRLKCLPSAQPETIRCRDCRKYRSLDCPMGITVFDAPAPDGYCYKAERRTDETQV